MADYSRTPTGVVVMASVDWLTATARSDVGKAQFEVIGKNIGAAQRSSGNALKPFGWQGYSGIQCGELTWGERHDSGILRISGPLAAVNWRAILPWATNVSRLDLEVTVRFSRFPSHLAQDGYSSLLADYPEEAVRPNFNLRMESHGGETLYLGKGASDKYARLYNKAKESNDPAYRNCWRYEIELKNRPAWTAIQHLAASAEESPLIATYVWRHFADRHVAPTFPPAVGDGLLPVPRARSTDERRLVWLATQVRACVQDLLTRGHGPAIRQALGY